MAEPVQIHLCGAFEVFDPRVGSVTPKSKKSRAILAMLATSTDLARSRQWVAERLWSDRSAQQASASLRQALGDIRKAFGGDQGTFCADRQTLWLDPQAVDILVDPDRGAFLEDIYVEDAAFKSWRASQPENPAFREQLGGIAGQLKILCHTDLEVSTDLGVVSEIIAYSIGNVVREQLKISAVVTESPADPPDVRVTVNLLRAGDGNTGLVKIVHVATGQLIFNKTFRSLGSPEALIESEEIAKAAFEAAELVTASLPKLMQQARRPELHAVNLNRLALFRMFSFDQSGILEADALLQQSFDTDENGLSLAWRALLKMILSMEQVDANQTELRDAAMELMWRASDKSPDNPMVQALVAITRVIMFGEHDLAQSAAMKALDASPLGAFSLQAAALSYLLQGDYNKAYSLSTKARNVVQHSRFKHWWDIQHSTIAVAAGRYDDARLAAEQALQRAPKIRPMLRQLITIHAHAGALEKAETYSNALENIEPGFSLERMMYDENYPVRTLRKSGLINSVSKLL